MLFSVLTRRSRSPDPVQLPSLREPGAWDSTGLQAPQAARKEGASRLHPMQTAAAMRWLRQGLGRGSPQHLKAWAQQWAALARALEPAGHSLQPVPQAPGSPTGPRPGELEGPREKAGLHLLSYSQSEDHHSTDHWLNAQTKGHSLTAGCLWEGPLQR